ncbi:hypothetical protein BTHE_1932 [Bifidobacterium thermophilum]|nr:hypothetical protein BTHE_1932 [Bifidobacterium thermophilum]
MAVPFLRRYYPDRFTGSAPRAHSQPRTRRSSPRLPSHPTSATRTYDRTDEKRTSPPPLHTTGITSPDCTQLISAASLCKFL